MSSPFPKTADKLKGVEILASIPDRAKHILNAEALALVATLHRAFQPTRKQLLANRKEQQAKRDRESYQTFCQKLSRLEMILPGPVHH